MHSVLPTFPNFKKLEIGDRKTLEEITAQAPPYSDYNFTSLWSYSTEEGILISSLNNNLVIKMHDYITNEPFYSFFGNNLVSETIHTLLRQAKKEGLPEKLKLIPEYNLLNDHTLWQKYNVQESTDNYDYVILLENIKELKKLHSSKHKLYNKFTTLNPQYRLVELNLSDRTTYNEILEVFNKRSQIRNKSTLETNIELRALKTLLTSAYLKLFSLGIYINNRLIAYCIDEYLNQQYMIGHFIKADPSFPGAYEVLNKASAEKQFERGYLYKNIEQDLGIEGLRMSKQHWNPVLFLKKYTITPKES